MTNEEKIKGAIKTLKHHGFSNRAILCNVNEDNFYFEEKEVNDAFYVLNEECIKLWDSNFDYLVSVLYSFKLK